MFRIKTVLKIFCNFAKKHSSRRPILLKLQDKGLQLYPNRTPLRIFQKFSKQLFSIEYLWKAASVLLVEAVLFFVERNESLLISFQSSRINGELRAFSILLLRTSKPTGGLQTSYKDITNNQGDLLQKR